MADPYISEIKYRGSAIDDFAEVVLDAGADPSGITVVIYHQNGNIRSVNTLGSIQNTQFGKDIYLVENGIHKDGAIALVQDGTVLSFSSFDSTVTPTTGPAAGMTSTQIGSVGNDQSASLSTDGGGTYTSGTISDGTIPCFLRGTLITTKRGEVAVEDLRPGDMVVVRDGGFEPIRWIGSVSANAKGHHKEKNAPICIPKGSMGRGMPIRDLYVSPNHRIWMRNPAYEVYFDTREILVPAKHLVGWKGISQVSYVTEPEYFHLLFDTHQIILSDGMPTESFHPGEIALDQFAHETRDELLQLFPSLLALAASGQTARRCLKGYEVPLAIDASLAA